ncbi:MAG: T9SS type A sorting domain-containing protein [Lewinellaceae bacterium]|nr:T9SS type A sorting domain-containing protein [Lewinellaceae bacterium]
MRLLLSSFFLIALANPICGQIIAGDTTGLKQGLAAINLGNGPAPFPTLVIKSDSLDLNGDGFRDVIFEIIVFNGFDGNGSSAYLSASHPGFSFIMGPEEVKRYVAGDTITADTNWSNPLTYSAFVYKSAGGFAGQNVSGGEWLAGSLGYVGFRLITPAQDTLHGWIRVNASSFGMQGAAIQVSLWAIEHTPPPSPFAHISVAPRKDVYCAGDTVQLAANIFGYDEAIWHFWDGTTDTSSAVVRILPDTSVTVTLEATGQVGSETEQVTLMVSPLQLSIQDDTLSCTFPSAILTAQTNIYADVFWQTDTGMLAGPIFEVDQPGVYSALAIDSFGCTATATGVVWADQIFPGDLIIGYDESNQLLTATTAASGASFLWTGGVLAEPVPGSTLMITQSGVYTVVATLPNGCTATASILVTISASAEPVLGNIRIAPNPVGAILLLENRFPLELRLKMFDPAGKQWRIFERDIPANGKSSLDTSVLPAGVYWLAGYNTAGRVVFTEKFVKL